jgi:hypothetical protein
MCHNSPSPLTAAACEGDVILAAASYQVPLLWLALFGSEDLTQVEMPMEDIEGSASTGKVPTLFAQVDVARSRYFTVRPCCRPRKSAEF